MGKLGVLQKINIPVKVMIGEIDEYVGDPLDAMEKIGKHVKDFDFRIINNALHSYLGYEKELADDTWEMLNLER